MSELRFDNRVVVVTGAGAGLGRAYAHLFASRGAKVVVNDLGGERHGDGSSSKAADTVVGEIVSKGGIAVADYNSVVEGEKIIKTALDKFGRVDVLVNNAGILRDKSFARISDQDWDLVHQVHLKGSFKTTQAAFPIFKKQKYGRIIMTASNSGIYGNFGQANYSAAKMGLIGLANTIALEGKKDNIHCNVIIPTAASRLTEDILPPEMFEELKPELIAPVVGYLCHETCEENGIYIDSAAGWAGKCEIIRSQGTLLRKSRNDVVTIENVRDSWDKVTNMNGALKLGSITEATGMLMSALEELDTDQANSVEKSEKSNPNRDDVFSYTSKDAILYALGVGTSLRIPENLKFLYESHEDFSVLPTFYILPTLQQIFTSDLVANAVPGTSVNLAQALHGEQYIEILGDLPTEGSLSSKISILEVLDKGSGAAVVVNVDSYSQSGELVIRNQAVIFFVGAGGFGGPRTGTKAIPCQKRPNRDPDYSISEKTGIDQAALYRLSGDLNPLHIDPNMAIASGFKTPILHGLATLGYSVRIILSAYANNDCKLFKAVKARFVKPVIPGQTLKVDTWRENNRIYFETSVVETNTVVIGGAYIDLKSANMQPLINTLSSELQSDAIFDYIIDQVKDDPQKARRIGGVFLYNITKDGKQIKQWTMDLENATVYEGAPKDVKPSTTFTISDEDFLLMAQGKLNPQVAFMKGKLKITGNLMIAQKLAPLLTGPKL